MNGRDVGTVRHADGTVGSPEAVAAYAVAREQYMKKDTSSRMEKVQPEPQTAQQQQQLVKSEKRTYKKRRRVAQGKNACSSRGRHF